MLKIHTRDGATTKVDLEDEAQAREWTHRLSDPRFQASITGLTVSHAGVQYSIPRPTGFEPVSFLAEHLEPNGDRRIKGGQRITLLAGDVRASVMVHREQRAARVSLLRIGKQRYNPGYNPFAPGE